MPTPKARGRRVEPPDPPLRDGERLSRDEFERRYDAMPDGRKAELLRGVVCLASPARRRHGRPHARLLYWLQTYEEATPGVEAADAITVRLDLENEPMPDAILCVEPSLGGQTGISPDDYVEGPPELVAEVSAGTLRHDLGLKLDLYREKGVLEYLVLRAGRREANWFHLEGATYERIEPGEDDILRSIVFPGLWLDPRALFRGDLRRLREVVIDGTSTPEHARFVERLARRG
jgi:Uma2 family endonuclease